MSIIIIIICIVLQRLLAFDYYSYQLKWLEAYFRWLLNTVDYLTEGHALASVLILLMPVVIAFVLFYSLIYHFLGVFVYAIFNFILVWLCIDCRDLIKKPYPNLRTADFFVITYERLFAVIFWFVVFGPAGLILYTAVISLRNLLSAESHLNLLFYVLKIKAVLDWVPIRLMGLSYAIVGHFSSVSKLWSEQWQSRLSDDAGLVTEYGSAALGVHKSALNNLQLEVVQIINRALVFWLMVIGILTLVFWLG